MNDTVFKHSDIWDAPHFASGAINAVRSFQIATWRDLKRGVANLDLMNRPHGLVRVRSIRLAALQQAVRQLAKRYAVLNCHLEDREGEPWLVPRTEIRPGIKVLDFGKVQNDEGRAEAERAIGEVVWEPFDVFSGPLFRVFAVRYGQEDFYLGLVAHQFIADAVSVGILISELIHLHDALARRKAPKLRPVTLQYHDYLRGINSWIDSEPGREACRETVSIMKDNAIVEFGDLVDKGNCSEQFFEFDKSVSASVRKMARISGTSPVAVLMAAQNILIHPYTRRDYSLLKLATTGREVSELTRIVGNLADRRLIRTPMSGNPTFLTVIHRTHTEISRSRKLTFVRSEFQYRDLSEHNICPTAPVFSFKTLQSNLLYPHASYAADMFPPLRVPPSDPGERTKLHEQYDLEILDDGQDLFGRIRYRDGQIGGLLQGLENILREGCSDCDKRVSDLSNYLSREVVITG